MDHEGEMMTDDPQSAQAPTAREWITAVYREEPPHTRYKIEQALEAAAEIAEGFGAGIFIPTEDGGMLDHGEELGRRIRAFVEEIRNAE